MSDQTEEFDQAECGVQGDIPTPRMDALRQEQLEALSRQQLGFAMNNRLVPRDPEIEARDREDRKREHEEYLASQLAERAAQARTAAIHAALMLEQVRNNDAESLVAEARKIEAFLNGDAGKLN